MKVKNYVLSTFLFAILVEVKSKLLSEALEHRIDGYKSSKSVDITLSYVYQPVDQLNYDTRLFRQYFWVDDSNYENGGPFFVFLMSQYEDPDYWLTQSHIREISDELNGAMFAIEPRYFGLSRPTEDLSIENLQYMTIEQTLADFVYWLKQIKQLGAEFGTDKIILFGYDLGATYATWLKYIEPTLVDGVIAYGPKLNVTVDFPEYFDIISETMVYEEQGDCGEIFAEAFGMIDDLIQAGEGELIQEIFNLNNPVDTTDPLEVGSLFSTFANIISSVLVASNSEGIKNFCNTLHKYRDETENDMEVLALYFRNVYNGEKLRVSYSEGVEIFRNESWDSVAATGFRQIYWRSCTQGSWFQTSSLLPAPIKDKFELDLFISICSDVFGTSVTKESIQAGNEELNTLYGDSSTAVEDVYITYGTQDPFKLLGPQEDLNARAPVDIISGVGRFSNIYNTQYVTIESVAQSQARAYDLIFQWTQI